MANLGAPVRDLHSVLQPVSGRADLIQQVHGAPLQAHARSCLWETEVQATMPRWFDTVESAGTALGMGIVCMHRERVVGRLRVSALSRQPFGLLHGGVSALVAEELGSIASVMNSAPRPAVGVQVAATHFSSASMGQMVIAVCHPLKRGGTLQIWQVDLYIDEEQTDESVAFTTNPLYHLTHKPAGTQLATCQLTTFAKKAPAPAKAPKDALQSKL